MKKNLLKPINNNVLNKNSNKNLLKNNNKRISINSIDNYNRSFSTSFSSRRITLNNDFKIPTIKIIDKKIMNTENKNDIIYNKEIIYNPNINNDNNLNKLNNTNNYMNLTTSNFYNIIPTVGVQIKENDQLKNGGLNFNTVYGRMSIKEYEILKEKYNKGIYENTSKNLNSNINSDKKINYIKKENNENNINKINKNNIYLNNNNIFSKDENDFNNIININDSNKILNENLFKNKKPREIKSIYSLNNKNHHKKNIEPISRFKKNN